MATDLLVGDIPATWESTTLGEVCRRSGGFIQTGPFGSQLHASDYVSVGVPAIMPVNIGDNRVTVEGIARIREGDAQRLSRHRVRAGDIIYSRRGDVERRALVRPREEGWLCGTGCLLVRLGAGVINPIFASYYFGHASVREWVVRHAVGATMPNLNTAIMSALPIVVPPMEEQQAIANVLSELDDKIDLNCRMNETLEAIARAIFKSWFVDFDPVRAKMEGRQPAGMDAETAALFPDSFEDSPKGRIPKGWSVEPVLSHADLISGGTPRTDIDEYWAGPIPWASAADVSQCGEAFLIGTTRSISERGLANSSTKIIPMFSTVVVARGATTGRLTMFGRDTAMNQTCYALRSRTGHHFFLYCLFCNSVEDLVRAAHGSVFDTITTATFHRAGIVAPPIEVANRFECLVSSLFRRILTSLQESRTLAALRDALLPKLLSGEIRVGDAARKGGNGS